MRHVLLLSSLAQLAACAGTEPPAAQLRARQEAACTSVIAAHVGRPVAEITSRRVSEAGGEANIEARDGNRLHLCTVDASGRVLGYSHPGA